MIPQMVLIIHQGALWNWTVSDGKRLVRGSAKTFDGAWAAVDHIVHPQTPVAWHMSGSMRAEAG